MTEAADRPVLLDRDGHVAVVTLNRPDRLNAMSQDWITTLLSILEALHDDDDLRAVVLRGNGRAFCAGADMDHEGFDTTDPAARLEMFESAYRITRLLWQLPVPVIAEINGAAAGAGMSLVACSDFRVASTEAFFRLSFIRLGLVPDMGLTLLLPRLVSPPRALEMALVDDRVTADKALEMGLVTEVVEPGELRDRVKTLAEGIAAKPPLAVKATKRLMRRSGPADFDSGLDVEMNTQNELHETEDMREGIAALREKRAPEFTGR